MMDSAAGGLVAGVDLGGTHISVALADATGAVIERADRPVDRHAGPTPILAGIAATVLGLLAAVPANSRPARTPVPRLLALAIGCPGIVLHDRGIVAGAANLGGWQRVPVRATLEDALGVPVRVENDVNMGALGEGRRGAARNMRDYVFIALGTGIGAGVVVDRRLVRGAHGYGGEIAYMVSEPALVGHGFEGRGNLEAVAGALALERKARALGLSGGIEGLFAAAAAGDERAAGVVSDAIRRLAAAVLNIAALLDPEVVIVGGGLSRQGEALLGPLRRLVAESGGPAVNIVSAALGTSAQLHGAIHAALEAVSFGDAGDP